MIEIRWHGRGGQGAFTAAKILGGAVVRQGQYALSFPSFGPERRGAPIQAFTKIGDTPIADRSAIVKGDYLVFLDETLYTDGYKKDLKAGGRILLNTRHPEAYKGDASILAIDADRISEEILKRSVSNTVMLTALAIHENLVSAQSIKAVLPGFLSAKVAAKNENIVDYVAQNFQKEIVTR